MSGGSIVQVIGAVVDVEFSRDSMPRVFNALTVDNTDITLEVQQQLGDGVVRTIALGSTDGLKRGIPVTDTGDAIKAAVELSAKYLHDRKLPDKAIDVIDEVGRDAARFIFLIRHYESALDFDLEVAKQKTNDNPVYYVQYFHARIASIMSKGSQRGAGEISWDEEAVARLTAPEEIELIKTLARYPDILAGSARSMEPHRVTYYLMELASAFHSYYNKHRVLTDDVLLRRGRLVLISAVQKVIRNGLTLLGVSAPERM